MCIERLKATSRELDRVGCWLKACRPQPSLEDIDAELIVRYVRQRTVCKAKATVSDIMSKLRCLGEFLVQEKYWQKNPLHWLRGPKLSPYAQVPCRIHRGEQTKLWQGALTVRSERSQHQYLAILALLYGLGLRRGEVERLDVTDWDAAQGVLQVDGRKTSRERNLPLMELVARCLETHLPWRQRHLEELGITKEPALFVNRYGGRLNGPAISAGVFRIARRMGIALNRLHQFRHTCASDLLEAGVALPEVQRVLGHVAITSTVRYLHFSDPQRRAAVERHPLCDWLNKGGAA
jgi:integrase/recombinase XerD